MATTSTTPKTRATKAELQEEVDMLRLQAQMAQFTIVQAGKLITSHGKATPTALEVLKHLRTAYRTLDPK